MNDDFRELVAQVKKLDLDPAAGRLAFAKVFYDIYTLRIRGGSRLNEERAELTARAGRAAAEVERVKLKSLPWYQALVFLDGAVAELGVGARADDLLRSHEIIAMCVYHGLGFSYEADMARRGYRLLVVGALQWLLGPNKDQDHEPVTIGDFSDFVREEYNKAERVVRDARRRQMRLSGQRSGLGEASEAALSYGYPLLWEELDPPPTPPPPPFEMGPPTPLLEHEVKFGKLSAQHVPFKDWIVSTYRYYQGVKKLPLAAVEKMVVADYKAAHGHLLRKYVKGADGSITTRTVRDYFAPHRTAYSVTRPH